MKKILIGLIVITSILLAGPPLPPPGGGGHTLVVDNTPWFGYSCEASWFPDYPYTTIQSAINAAHKGDTIKICKGDYNEKVTIDAKDDLTVTNGTDAPSPSDINWYSNGDTLSIDRETKNLIVENLSINSTAHSSNNKNIHIESAKDRITFQNLVINTPNGASAIYGEYGVDSKLKGVFKNLSINSGSIGIYMQKGDLQTFEDINITLSGNSANDDGIYLGSSVKDENHIFKNLSFSLHSQPAIKLSSGKKMTFEDINISADSYSNTNKAIELDWNTKKDNLTFKDINITLNAGTGISIAKAKDINVENTTIKGTTQSAFLADSGVDGNFNFKNIKFLTNGNNGLLIKNGKDVTIDTATINGTSGNGYAVFTDWGVVGNYNFKDINIAAHAGGISIKKGNNVSFDNIKVNSDSSSSNDKGVSFDSGDFKKMTFTNCDINATGDALKIAGSSDLTVDSSKLTTRGDHAIDIGTNVTKMHLKNSCFHNESNGGNSYAIYINNWQNDIHINNNCIYAPNGGNYARDSKSHDWDGNYWDGVSDINGDGKISRADTNKISMNIIDNLPLSSCQNSCNNTPIAIAPILNYQMDECSWNGTSGEVKDSSGNGYNATALNRTNTTISGKLCRAGNLISTKSSDKAIEEKTNISLPHEYTLITWIKFPLDTNGHKIFSNGNNIYEQYFNIADRVGSSHDFIYFTNLNYQNQEFWYLSVNDDTNTDTISLNPQNYNGWHMLTFVVTNSGTIFYFDNSKNHTFSTHPNTGNLGLLFNSDYGSNSNNKPNGQSIGAKTDEFKIFTGALTQGQISNIYNNENSGKNYDGTNRTCSICNNNNNYKFDAWDTFRSIKDRNISTKIVNQDFNLTIASLDENGTSLQDFNGTVCAKIGNSNAIKLLFKDKNTSTATFNVSNAIRHTRVHLSWEKDANSNCPLVNENNETNSTDNFAIRPKKFKLIPTAPYYAGDDFNISFKALDGKDNNTTDYNESLNGSFKIESNITKKGCFQGDLNVSNFSFVNGLAKDINSTYSNLGDINITIEEINGSEFAKVDEKDTNDSQRLITPYTTTITVKPYELNVTNVKYINSTNKSWLYDANVSDMNVTVFSVIKAFAKNSSAPLADFNSTCYAKDVNVSFLYDSNYTDGNISLQTKQIDGNLSYIDINNSYITIPSNNFKNGEANATYAFNVLRKYNRALNPVKIKLKDINITTTSVSKLTNDAISTSNIKDDQNSTFYYGKLYTNDIETYEQNITSALYIDLYCSNCSNGLNGFFQDSLNWYRNGSDGNITNKNNIAFFPRKDILFSSQSKNNIQINNISNAKRGTISFDINNSLDKYDTAVIHFGIPVWLWYNNYKNYSFGSGSDCSTHPCIDYKLIKNTNQNSIKSGSFKGADIGHEQNSTIKRVGVKVYR